MGSAPRRHFRARPAAAAARQWPEFLFELPELQFPARLNAAVELLDRRVERRATATARA